MKYTFLFFMFFAIYGIFIGEISPPWYIQMPITVFVFVVFGLLHDLIEERIKNGKI